MTNSQIRIQCQKNFFTNSALSEKAFRFKKVGFSAVDRGRTFLETERAFEFGESEKNCF